MKNFFHLIAISFIILMIFPIDWSYAIETKQSTFDSSLTTESKEESEASETTVSESSSSQESSKEEESFENEIITDSNNINDSKDENNSEINSKNMLKADVAQDIDGFWLVDSATTLTEYLKDSQKLKFRLTNNIDLGSTGYQLKDGMIIDGADHIITYNKGGSATSGFYANQANAVIEIRNTQFGNSDGSGAVGYYGFLSGGSAANMTFIFDGVDYYSTNGQMIYNVNGSVIMRGQNTIDQRGTSSYSQEWAEINYVEIQNGHTAIQHSSNQTSAFIWSTSSSSANPYAGKSQIVVKENAQLDIQTNCNMTYGTLAPSYIVERNAVFNLDKVSLVTGGTRNQFFASSQTQPVTFDFQEQSQVNFKLPLPINLYSAKGGLTIAENADVSIDVANGGIFTTASSSTFGINMNKVKQASFSGTSLGTFGLNGANGVNNLSFKSNYLQKIETFSSKTSSTPTQEIIKQASDLSVQGTNFTNIAGTPESFSDQEILALKDSQKIVFSEYMDVPDQVGLVAADETDTSVSLSGASFNNGSPAKEVKFFMFTSEDDINDLKKAKQIVTLTNFDNQQNTIRDSTYQVTIDDLNPNTTFWAQMVVINQAGESDFSDAVMFTTKPQLKNITATVTTTSALIEGELASDTGKWTDYSNGEAAAIPNQNAYYGGIYQQVKVEYSQSKDFLAGATKSQIATLSGDKKQKFTTKLNGLDGDVTYYVRVRVTGASGEEVTLAMTPLTEFQTITEIIKVEIPIEMAFQTQNKDLGTLNEGEISSVKYPIINKGNTPTKISITNLLEENAAANHLQLLDSLSGKPGQDELALQLLVDNNQAKPLFLTNDLSKNPLSIGDLNVNEEKNLSLQGKYYNPMKQAVSPTYKVTFKVEKKEE